jgi:hypothetical protein
MKKPDNGVSQELLEEDYVRGLLRKAMEHMSFTEVQRIVGFIDKLKRDVQRQNDIELAGVNEMKRRCMAIAAHKSATQADIYTGIRKVDPIALLGRTREPKP